MTDVSEPVDPGKLNDTSGSQQGQDPEPATWQRFHLDTDHDAALKAAQQAIREGKCIVLPTDTVYGIGANAFSAEAVQGLLNAKHRGRDMPPPVLIAEPGMLPALVASVPAAAKKMIEKCWPGALTLILRAPKSLRMDLGETSGTIAVRVPAHDGTRELLRHTGPLAVSSANISGMGPATNVDGAISMLGNSVAVYLDGGDTPGPTASTIVDFTQKYSGRILRAGVISFDELKELCPKLEDLPPEPDEADQTQADSPQNDSAQADQANPESPQSDSAPTGSTTHDPATPVSTPTDQPETQHNSSTPQDNPAASPSDSTADQQDSTVSSET